MTPAQRLIAETEAYLAAHVPINHQAAVTCDQADMGFDPEADLRFLDSLDHLNEERMLDVDSNSSRMAARLPVRPGSSRGADPWGTGPLLTSETRTTYNRAARGQARRQAERRKRAQARRFWILAAVGILAVLACCYVFMCGLAAVMA